MDFQLNFILFFWPDISDMLFNSYKYSFDNGIMSMSQRNGVITLLPKKDKDCMYIKKNYRPISLLTVDYKIFAKMLANRLKKYLHIFNIVNLDQSGFLKGRNIGNNIRLILDITYFSISRRHLIMLIFCSKSLNMSPETVFLKLNYYGYLLFRCFLKSQFLMFSLKLHCCVLALRVC